MTIPDDLRPLVWKAIREAAAHRRACAKHVADFYADRTEPPTWDGLTREEYVRLFSAEADQLESLLPDSLKVPPPSPPPRAN